LENVNQFQRLVGKLIYLTITRPDLSYSVSQISQFMHAPKTPHLDTINRILKYLKGSPGKGIWIKKIVLMTCVAIPMQIGQEALIENLPLIFAHL
jgi:hypothetical protein